MFDVGVKRRRAPLNKKEDKKKDRGETTRYNE